MGCTPMFSGGSNTVYTNVNPSPTNFKVNRCYFHNGYTVVIVNYPDCTNYEGDKILVFIGDYTNEIKVADTLDPHFLEDSSLIARFAPSKQGYLALSKLTYN